MKKSIILFAFLSILFLQSAPLVKADPGITCCMRSSLNKVCHWIIYVGPNGNEMIPVPGVEVRCPEM
ncbi:hypothetical protein [Algoriphagus zhangzhouensis]|uniref:Uncharacterized protein n=1 Tax=Algoriphagus zhangzhouensis TaxID=1073327 RepID=A0A1M7Z9L3_9BACT|nr:hypothetical protein [Algoriphagus zhangzhouensis]TDY47345.1 hypothetical protein A8938_1799 [Algoriphagus zhangzhouensis]SHO61623.1 hypothetical protein SAMN04488108_1463 [Algoriphagus zhangzhouensis]